MIDLHCHILPGIDDGARTVDESLTMAMLAADDGVETVVATPHSPGSVASREYSADLIREQVAALNAALREQGVPLSVLPGTEVAFDADVPQQLRNGQLLTYAGTRTVLLELATNTIPSSFEMGLFAIQAAGFRVLLAHPERIVEVQQNPNLLLPLIERGVLAQVTGEALNGRQGERMQYIATTLLTHGMIHVIASDAHGASGRRPPLLAFARDAAAALVGEAAAQALVRDTPAAILAGRSVVLAPPRPVDLRAYNRHLRAMPRRGR